MESDKRDIMKFAITYAELQEYVASHFKKTVNLGYVDGYHVATGWYDLHE